MDYKRGIDVSQWQGVIDWEAVKASGVEFAMIRAGYGQNNIDPQFKRNADECTRLGIPFGVYWFSYAYSPERAASEARKCIETISPYTLDYPVAWDFEYDSADYIGGKGYTLTEKLCSDMARAFLGEIETARYYPMLYTNADYLARYFDDDIEARYDVWLAQWPTHPDPANPPRAVGIWQYANDGVVSGITANVVDLDACYKDYPSIIQEGRKVVYHTRDDIAEKADWGLDTFDKLVKRGYLEGTAEGDYDISRDMLRTLVILDRARAFDN